MAHTLKLLTVSLMALAAAGCQNTADVMPSKSGSQASSAAQPGEAALSFEGTLKGLRKNIDSQIERPLVVPVPKDAGGGYTHEQHKRNAKAIYDAGALYEFTGDKKYADFAAALLLEYAQLYPTLGLHPKQKEQSPGRLFWQNLNESWWLVYAAQGFDKIQKTLSEEDRASIEKNVLRAISEFLSVESPETFNKVHNHGTWANAAVGLTGYAIGDDDYVEKALLGLDKSGNYGFLKQLDKLFSPDGYYNEGPYYQRYALMPFVLFGQAVQANNPERGIFAHRDEILKKAIYMTIQQSYGGLFFPINDAIKDKDIATAELQYGVAIAYDLTGDPGLLSIAQVQGQVVPTAEGKKLLDAIAAGKAEPFAYQTMRLRDGALGTEGALDILRASADPNDLTLVAKNTSQGLGHGHFDKMGVLLYDQGQEIIRDYGAARFLNVEAKYGGHYLAENNKYAKQTIAHNALVVDETSHFNGVTAEGNKHAPELGAFVDTDTLKATSAEISTAYDGVRIGRTVAMIKDPALPRPIIIDLVEGHSDASHQYDLPFFYNGQLVETNFKIEADTKTRTPLGFKNGYQYLWKVGQAAPDTLSQVTWLLDRQFYSVSTAVPTGTSVIFAEIGASDPDFNLRREPAFILRANGGDGVSFASVIEPHGDYNPTVEYTVGSHSQVAAVTHAESGADEFIEVTLKSGKKIGLALADSSDNTAQHSAEINGKTVSWTGPYGLFGSEHAIYAGNE